MEPSIYSIRKSFLLPLGLVVLLSVTLLCSALLLGLPPAKVIILCAFLVPVCILFIESSVRRVKIDETSVQVKSCCAANPLTFHN